MTNIDNDRDLVLKLKGRAKFLRDRGEIKSPELMEHAADALARAKAKWSLAIDLPGWIDVAMTEDQLDVVIWAWNKARFPHEQERHQAEFDQFIASSLARAQSDKAVSVEALEEAYRLGFIAACKWSEPVTQDADSTAFAFERDHDLRTLIAKETGDQDQCEHEWVDGSNKYVSNVSVCLRCKTIRLGS